MKVAALVGKKEHAIKQVEAGVDLLVVSGTEGGGHCGSGSTTDYYTHLTLQTILLE